MPDRRQLSLAHAVHGALSMSSHVENREREDLLAAIERYAEWPLIVLALVWLALLAKELTSGLSPGLQRLGEVIWGIFIVEYLARFFLAPDKSAFLKRSWVTLVALVIPAIRIFRVLRIARLARGVRLARIVTGINRGMRALGRTMSRRGVGYVTALTVVIVFTGSAGMYAFERMPDGTGLQTYGEALWWTAMLITTIGSEYWPQSAEGRVLTFLLSLYALAMLGYIAASLATFFIGQDAESRDSAIPNQQMIEELRDELRLLREDLKRSGDSG